MSSIFSCWKLKAESILHTVLVICASVFKQKICVPGSESRDWDPNADGFPNFRIFFIFVCVFPAFCEAPCRLSLLCIQRHTFVRTFHRTAQHWSCSVVVGWRINPIDLCQPITVFHNACRCHSSMFAIINPDSKNALLCEWEKQLCLKQHNNYGPKQEFFDWSSYLHQPATPRNL